MAEGVAIPESSPPLPRAFYDRGAIAVARDLLGRVLVRRTPEGAVSGRIVEVEAYLGERDEASHARPGRTARNASMYGPPGHAYVYFTYGMHHCVNVVVEREGFASAVLLRAVEPRTGLVLMAKRRRTSDPAQFASGPGRLTEAFALDRAHDGVDLTRGEPLWITSARVRAGREGVVASRRIGIRVATERLWRFTLEAPVAPRARAARFR